MGHPPIFENVDVVAAGTDDAPERGIVIGIRGGYPPIRALPMVDGRHGAGVVSHTAEKHAVAPGSPDADVGFAGGAARL